jgi:sulfofructose kinase
VTLARLGVPVAFVGAVGDDPAGGFIREGLTEEGVDVRYVRSVGDRSAVSAIWVAKGSGQRSIAAFGGHPVGLSDAAIDLCRLARWVHVDHRGFTAVQILRAAGVETPVAVDAGNPIPALDLSLVDLYGPTEQQLLERFPGRGLDAAIEAAIGEGPPTVVVTRGEKGSVAGRRAGRGDASAVEFVGAPAFQAEVRSTLGAGDVFHGALLAALVRGLDLADALRHANVAAALSCQALDGRSAIPDWPALARAVDRDGID